MEDLEFSKHNPPTLTKALELAFALGSPKISLRIIKGTLPDGRSDFAISINTLKEFIDEALAIAEAITVDDVDKLEDLKNKKNGNYFIVLDKADMEVIKDVGCFHEIDTKIRNDYLRNCP